MTNPWLKSVDIDRILECPSDVVSVAANHRFMWSVGNVIPNYDPNKRPRRQDDLPLSYIENGAIYKSTVGNIKRSKCRIMFPVGVYVMAPYTFLEIDEPIDLEVARLLCDFHNCDPDEL